MDKLNDLISKRLSQHKLGDSAKASLILHTANILISQKFKTDQAEIKALRLKEGVLTIGTVSSVWSQELWGYNEELMKEIQKEHGPKSIIKIMIHTSLESHYDSKFSPSIQ